MTLFNGRDLSGWQGATDGYEAVNGEIRSKPGVGGNLLTVEEFADFVLRFDFRLTPGGNNGLAIRTPDDGKPHPGLARTQGHVGFAGHHDEVHFRSIRIKRLP